MGATTVCPQVRQPETDQSIRIAGGSTGILLIHGLGGTPVEMRYVANGLARAGHTVHVPQLAGHCLGIEDLKATRWEDWYESVEREHDLMRETCDRVVVGGLSMGAVMAVHHAAQHRKDVAGTLLYAPCFWLDGWAMPWYSGFAHLLKSKWLAEWLSFPERDPWGVKDPRTREIVRQAMSSGDNAQAGVLALPGAQMLELQRLIRTTKSELDSIEQPALVMHPREDDHASLRNLELLQARLRGRLEAVVMNDSYHIITIDRQRHLVVDRSVDFVDRLTRSDAEPSAKEDDFDWSAYRARAVA